MTQRAITTMVESVAVQTLANVSRTLRRKKHAPAQVTKLADQIGDHLVANVSGFGGTTTAALREAAESAVDTVAAVSAINDLKS
ncbi:MAG: hypothetical protein WD795_22000 [Woeseia sp.]